MLTEKPNYQLKVTVSGNDTYVAKATVGTAQSSAYWQAKKISDDGTTLTIKWADGNDRFDNVATNLTTLTYV